MMTAITEAEISGQTTSLTPPKHVRFGMPMNRKPEAAQLPKGFLEFLRPLHEKFTPWQRELIEKRQQALERSHAGQKPQHLRASKATREEWKIALPDYIKDQRNQMTGPADDAELVVKMLNSGAPGVMLDLEDSTANNWENIERGVENILSALRGQLTYFDKKRNQQVAIKKSPTVILLRARGLHLSQAGIFGQDERGTTSASLYDVARLVFHIDWERDLRHPLTFYIPKSESAEEALWWRELFQELAQKKGWGRDAIKCMALVEAHPMAFQMEEFIYNLREHLVGLNLGRWDYMASLIHFNLADPEWILPDRNTIPHDVAFFQNLRGLLVELCHKRGILAIGGMTALYPSREDAELNARALAVLEKDKKNESDFGFDGAWTGHPDQNQIAVDQFPAPNQMTRRNPTQERYPDLRPVPRGVGQKSITGTRAAIRTVIRYRNGVLNGKGASLLDGYMEDLATDRIYRLMIAQRMRHGEAAEVKDENGKVVAHTPELINRLFDEELEKILNALPKEAPEAMREKFKDARRISEAMIVNGEFDPI